MSIAACLSGDPVDRRGSQCPPGSGVHHGQPISELGLKPTGEQKRPAGQLVMCPLQWPWSPGVGGERPMVVDGYPWSPVPALTSRFGFWHSWFSRCAGGAD
jgi:hypothetical protein